MDPMLEEDLMEALGGLDPEELLLISDPELASIALEVQKEDDLLQPQSQPQNGHLAGQQLDLLHLQDFDLDLLQVDGSELCSVDSSPDGNLGRFEELLLDEQPCQQAVAPSATEKCGNKRTPKGGRSKKQPSEKDASCEVCGRPARGYKYYGAIVCNSCRAFFSRSVKNDAHLNFVCLKSGPCPVDSKSWSSCQRCRYDKCVSVGMSVEQSASTSSTARPTPAPSPPSPAPSNSSVSSFMMSPSHSCVSGGDDKSVDGEDDDAASNWKVVKTTKKKVVECLAPVTNLTLEERLELEHMVTRYMKVGYGNVGEYIAGNLEVLNLMFEIFYQGRPMPMKAQKHMQDYLTFCVRKQSGDDPFMINVKPKDRLRLIEGNWPIISEFMGAFNLSFADRDFTKDFEEFLDVVKSGMDWEKQKTVDRLQSEASEGFRLPPKMIGYDQYYVPDEFCQSDPATIRRHRQVADKIASLNVACRDQKRDPDIVQYMLTVLVMVFTPDFLDLDDAKEAERLQAMFAYTLHRYLKNKRDLGGRHCEDVFRESMMATSYARELYEIRKDALRKLKLIY